MLWKTASKVIWTARIQFFLYIFQIVIELLKYSINLFIVLFSQTQPPRTLLGLIFWKQHSAFHAYGPTKMGEGKWLSLSAAIVWGTDISLSHGEPIWSNSAKLYSLLSAHKQHFVFSKILWSIFLHKHVISPTERHDGK